MIAIRKILLPVMFMSLTSWLNAQGLALELNCPRDSDTLRLWEMMEIYPGYGGDNALWEIGGTDGGHPSYMYYTLDTLGIINETWDNKRKRLDIRSGHLVEISEESPLVVLTYHIPKLRNPFPMERGDSLSLPFGGNGVYSGKYPFNLAGQVLSSADASGSFVLPEGDTINHVLRIHTVTSQSIRMAPDTSLLQLAEPALEIQDRFEWFALGHRYPICVMETRTTYDDCIALATSRKSYICLPDSQSLSPDPVNERLSHNDSIVPWRGCPPKENIIHYYIENKGNSLYFIYSLDEDTEVSVLLCDIYGIVHFRQMESRLRGGQYTMILDHSSLPRGNYVLYIRAGMGVYNEKFTKL